MAKRAKDGTVLLDNIPAKAQRWKAENEARNRAQAEAMEAEQQRQTGRVCMFKVRNLNSACYRDCALYEGGCVLGGAEPRETEGKYCPIIGKKCADSCALHSDGCTLRPVRS